MEKLAHAAESFVGKSILEIPEKICQLNKDLGNRICGSF
jgi:hypothetical protein